MEVLQTIVQEQIVNNIPLTVPVYAITDEVLSVNYTYYIRVGTVIHDTNGISYKVVSFIPDVSITVDKLGFVGNILVRIPFFFWGTRKATNREYLNYSNSTENKVPLVWLLEPFTEQYYDSKNSKDRTVNARFFFMDYYRTKWTNDGIKVGSQFPMYQLAKMFVDTITANRSYFERVESWEIIPRTRFGTGGGSEEKVLNDDLSGCELIITFTILDQPKRCGAPIVTPVICADGTVKILDKDGNELRNVTVRSGRIVPVTINSSTVTLKNTSNTVLDSIDVLAEGAGEMTAPNATASNSTGSYELVIPSGTNGDIPDTNYTLVDSEGTTGESGTVVSVTGGDIELPDNKIIVKWGSMEQVIYAPAFSEVNINLPTI